MASWGNFGPSLEAVTVLTSLSFFGDANTIGVTLKEEDQKRVHFLNKSLSDSRNAANKATYLSWAMLFEMARGGTIGTR